MEFSSPAKSLEDRFLDFIRTIEGAEFVDELELSAAQKEAQKADFFFSDRTVICELKSLKTNTEPKIEPLLEPYRGTETWPVFYGNWNVSKILKHLPDSEKINRKLINAVSSSAHGAIRSANQQIRSTKKLFSIPDAGGLLVLLNDSVQVLGPDLLLKRVGEILRKRKPNGDLQFPEIDVTWILTETHLVKLHKNLVGLPAGIIADWNSAEIIPVADLVETLQPLWAEFNGLPFVRSIPDELKTEILVSRKEFGKQFGPEKRSDRWRRIYREAPYLSEFTKEEILWIGRYLLMAIQIAGSTQKDPLQPRDRFPQLISPWTHFLEEINRRGIDMRELDPPKEWKHPCVGRIYRECGETVQKGRFYSHPRTAFNYYCQTNDSKVAVLEMIEAYDSDSGVLIQAVGTMPSANSEGLLEVVSKGEIHRLDEIRKRRNEPMEESQPEIHE